MKRSRKEALSISSSDEESNSLVSIVEVEARIVKSAQKVGVMTISTLIISFSIVLIHNKKIIVAFMYNYLYVLYI